LIDFCPHSEEEEIVKMRGYRLHEEGIFEVYHGHPVTPPKKSFDCM